MTALVLLLTSLCGAQPGAPLTIETELTYTVKARTTVVVGSALPVGAVYACNPVQRWRDPQSGAMLTWTDPCLAGVRVRWQRPDGVWTDGVADRGGWIWRGGVRQIRLDEQPQMRPRPRTERLPWELRR